MSVIDTLIIDRTLTDVLQRTEKGSYNASDLNRVIDAMDYLKARFETCGYAVEPYGKIKIDRSDSDSNGSLLPDGYTQVEYIESSGTQYIDTGFVPNQDTRIVMDASVTIPEGYASLFGSRDAAAKNGFCAFVASNGGIQSDYGSKQEVASESGVIITGDRCLFDKNKNVMIVDGAVAHTSDYEVFSCSYPAYLLTINNGGSPRNDHVVGKLYSCQIYNSDSLVLDFVPCINPSGDVGLFDVVNKQFYGNAGSGAFEAGPEFDTDSETDTEIVYDPYQWYDFDYPTPSQMNLYLTNLATLRAQFTQMTATPAVPADMEQLTYTEANDIEKILAVVDLLLTNIMAAWFYSGELYSGEV